MFRQLTLSSAVVAVASFALPARAQTTWYVDDDASLGGDGTSWPTAYKYLQDALAVATGGDEIHVAGGTYKPDQDEGGSVTPGDRTATFQLISGVELYGGYRGCPGGDCGGADPDERGIDLYETILTGDLNGDDDSGGDNSENTFHVVTGSGTDESAILDGLTITGGNADSEEPGQAVGGGMYIHSGSPTVMSCTFRDNVGGREEPSTSCCCEHDTPGCSDPACEAAVCAIQPTCCTGSWDESCVSLGDTLSECWYLCNKPPSGCGPTRTGGGAGMYNENGAPLVTNCTFSGNISDAHGGGILSQDSSLTVENCVFVENTSAAEGGGIYSDSDVSLTLTDCTFSGNTALGGGGVYVQYSSGTTLDTCTFSGNEARSFGGGARLWSSPDTILIDCQFLGNHGALQGGGLSSATGSPTFINCLFSANSTDFWGGGLFLLDPSATLTACIFTGNSASRGAGLYNSGTQSILTNCTFTDNISTFGGGMYNASSDPTLTNCEFNANFSATAGGGMYNFSSGPTLTNCMLNGNSAGERGGGVYNNSDCDLALTNSTFSANFAPNGSALGCDSYPSNVQIANSILWDGADEIWNNNGSTIIITYSDIQGGWEGEGNIGEDPLFVDADGLDDIPGTDDDNLRLRPGSPCIDVGDNNAIPPGVTTDLDGNPRVLDGNDDGTPIVDMGAYEYQGDNPIPAVSEWGLVVMTLLVLVAGTVANQRRRVTA
ncbi:MAG: IPTL-CTERM sorting domain-containing protein [Phycisphaerales bacterium]|nr:MAG: IPTL-CTERM sorting domain-containing protein [Phycisphaerales bacterium]